MLTTISSDTLSVQEQFKDLNALLIKVMSELSRADDPTTSVAVQDLSQITNSMQLLQSKISEQLHTGQRQLQALVSVGSEINSSKGLERVLNKVMDSVIGLMRAERGFLVLRDDDGTTIILPILPILPLEGEHLPTKHPFVYFSVSNRGRFQFF